MPDTISFGDSMNDDYLYALVNYGVISKFAPPNLLAIVDNTFNLPDKDGINVSLKS